MVGSDNVGMLLGTAVGSDVVGVVVGNSVGSAVGAWVGSEVVGARVGAGVGLAVGHRPAVCSLPVVRPPVTHWFLRVLQPQRGGPQSAPHRM